VHAVLSNSVMLEKTNALATAASRALRTNIDKDKIKTKLFQQKIQFLADMGKYRQAFENSFLLNEWRQNRYKYDGKLHLFE
jgi:hypothetical protein